MPLIIIDHVLGSRRGQRQEFPLPGPDGEGDGRLRFGRHPDNEVSFDARRDLDASSRHAELSRDGDRFVLRDIGSSNGTFIQGEPVSEVPIGIGEPVVVEFGAGGPKLRIFIGEPDELPPLPDVSDTYERLAPVIWIGLGLTVAAIVAAAIVAWILLV